MDIKEFWELIKAVGDWAIDGGDIAAISKALCHGTDGSLRTGGSGHAWEKVFVDECKSRGFCCVDVSSQQKKYDAIVNGKRVQCKFIGKGRTDIGPRGRNREGVRKYHQRDFDILAVAKETFAKRFLIPSAELADCDGWLSTTFHSHFWYWKEKWEVFEVEECERNDMLF